MEPEGNTLTANPVRLLSLVKYADDPGCTALRTRAVIFGMPIVLH